MTEEKKTDKTAEHHAKVISFINMKGGVGKTTLTINVGYTLFKEGFNVLIIDMDPQFNATQALMTKFYTIEKYAELRNDKKTISSLLILDTSADMVNGSEDEDIDVNDIILNLDIEKGSKLDLIPGDLSLTRFESTSRGSELLLQNSLEEINNNTYDYILIDTPATYSIYTQASLIASKFYITPVSPDTFSALGYSLLQQAMRKDILMKRRNLNNAGIVFTMYNEKRKKRTSLADDLTKVDGLTNENILEHKLSENENIRSGNLQNFLYDMSKTHQNIVDVTKDITDSVKEIEKNEVQI